MSKDTLPAPLGQEASAAEPERGLVSVSEIPISKLRPSPENNTIYRPVVASDPAIREMSVSIAEFGILDEIVITLDWYIISGHRRCAAAKLAGRTTVPCRVEPFRRADDLDRFVRLLREHNRARDKTNAEKLREELVSTNPEVAYKSLVDYRREKSSVAVAPIAIGAKRKRPKISKAKMPFLQAAVEVIEKHGQHGVLSVRQIHYQLLNDPPLKNTNRPDEPYDNTELSYKNLSKLLTQARTEGYVSWDAIQDETRPLTTWTVHDDVRGFIREEKQNFLFGYWRDLMQSQPHHIEIVGEKNTVAGTVRSVAMKYCIPMTIGRGYSSVSPQYNMANRYWASGKDKLIVLMVSDFDPEGEDIAASFARNMRDDHGIADVYPIKVALTADQVERFKLPKKMEAKKGSSRTAKFVEEHGVYVWELESLTTDVLQGLLHDTIDSVIDIDAFNAELEAEKKDAQFLDGVRRVALEAIQGIDMADMDDE